MANWKFTGNALKPCGVTILFVESARVELELTQQQMDQLFILAATKEP